jgi:dephospho-CoA kinase
LSPRLPGAGINPAARRPGAGINPAARVRKSSHGDDNPMQVIGILGGVAGGKSLVARQLAELGAGVLDADGAGHAVLRTPEVEQAARRRWGDAVFGPDGRIDRARLAGIVFAEGPEAARERKYLEELTHPEIGRRLGEQAERMAAEGVRAAVLDAPLLVEAGWDAICDRLVFVEAPREIRLARARQRGWTDAEFSAREGVQAPLDLKRGRAGVIIDNAGTPTETRAQVERFWHTLTE